MQLTSKLLWQRTLENLYGADESWSVSIGSFWFWGRQSLHRNQFSGEIPKKGRMDWANYASSHWWCGFYTSASSIPDGSLMDGSAGAGIFCESPELKISIPLGQYTSVFQAETYAIWQWVASKKMFNMNKRRLRILVGTVTGHISCNYHLQKFGLRQSTLCDRCQSDQGTMYYLVCLCPSLAERRLQILGRPVLNSFRELQQLLLSKIMDFVTPFLGARSSIRLKGNTFN